MPEVTFIGPSGRLEGRFQEQADPSAPVALVLHPHPQFGGNMNHRIVYETFYTFQKRGFSVLRFNFRGVGRSQGVFDNGIGELSDAAAALDWLQQTKPNAPYCWIAGFSFGAWISMQLLMRRPEIAGFISIAPPANMYDFSFLAPCPSSGLLLHGTSDRVVPEADVDKLNDRLAAQKGIIIDHIKIAGANHFFEGKVDELIAEVDKYIEMRLAPAVDEADQLDAKGRKKR